MISPSRASIIAETCPIVSGNNSLSSSLARLTMASLATSLGFSQLCA